MRRLLTDDGSLWITIQAVPTNAAVIGADRSDSLFTIHTSIALLGLSVRQAPQGAPGEVVTWRTSPGPANLSGYQVDRSDAAAGA